MLVLTRRIGESLIIDNKITITTFASKETKYELVSTPPKTWQFIVRKRTTNVSGGKKQEEIREIAFNDQIMLKIALRFKLFTVNLSKWI